MELTMVKAQAYLRAGKTRKLEVLDNFCEGRDTAGDMRPVSCSRQDSALSWERRCWSEVPRNVCAGTSLPCTALRYRRH
jgi:hypothetical protein